MNKSVPTPTKVPRIWQLLSRLLLIVFGIALALVLSEIVLQIGAALRPHEPQSQSLWRTARRRVLCLGDSNTYGVYLERSQAYPAVFEAQWNSQNNLMPVEVLNLGFPGTNSSTLVRRFPDLLRVFRPHIVTVLVGANDFWTVPERREAHANAVEQLVTGLWTRSRVFRLLYMLRQAIFAQQLQVAQDPSSTGERGQGTVRYGADEFELGWTVAPKERRGVVWQLQADLRKNLMTLAREAKEAGVQLLFLTYLSDDKFYGLASRDLRAAALTTGTPLVDLNAQLRATCPTGRCAELLADQHPSAQGHVLVAHALVEAIRQFSQP